MDFVREEIQRELTEHILPFWMKLKDEKNGGFFGRVHYDLQVDEKGEKGGIASARILWSFSAAYRITKNEKYLGYATHEYDFLVNKVFDYEYDGVYWMLDYKGEPLDTRKHVYAQAFAIYALSEYYRATGVEDALELAKRLYRLIETKGFNPDNNAYKEEFNRQWMETANEMLSENGVIADITTNTHLHVLEAYTNLYRVWPAEELRDRLTNLVYIFRDKIFDKETKFQRVFFDKNWNEIIELKSYGHDIEASWLLDEAVRVLNLEDESVMNMIIGIAYNIAEEALQPDGSLVNEKEHEEVDYTRVWWVQVEAVVGFYNAYERTGDKKFLYIVEGLWKYIKENLVDKREGGEWFWSIEKDGKPTVRDVVEPWKLPYHNSRFCMEMIERMK